MVTGIKLNRDTPKFEMTSTDDFYIYIFRFPFHWVKRFINESEKKQSENKERVYVLYILTFLYFNAHVLYFYA